MNRCSILCALVLAACSDSGGDPPGQSPAQNSGTGGAAGGGAAAAAGGSAGSGVAAGSGAGTGASAGSGGSPDASLGGSSGDAGGADAATQPEDAAAPAVLQVMSVEPAARGVAVPVAAPIAIHFDRAVDRATVTPQSFWAFGRYSGPVRDGAYAFADDDRTVTLTPPRAWTAGDRVTVVLSHALAGADGSKLRASGHSFQFTTATQSAAMDFAEVQRMSTRTGGMNGPRTQSYGGAAADLNKDGFLDLMIVNEVTADMRIFINKADGTGTFESFEQDTIVKLGLRASPSDTTDFDGDGIIDVVVANLDANSLSIVLGKGDGTMSKSQDLPVAGEPRGVAVADIDGDGDVDVINTNANGDNMSILVNDGTGHFPEPGDDAFFDAGHGMQTVSSEFGLGAADMDEDAVLDLVIGAHGVGTSGSGVAINRGEGDGTFSLASFQAPQTRGWQLAVGDLNGDGHDDVATADGALGSNSTDTVTILLGDGSGKLDVHQSYTRSIAQPFAIDLGDLDGDGDLDVVVSNYGGDWEIMENDGEGTMAFARQVTATRAASCAILLDADNDGDLDTALIDEVADEVVIMRQQ